MSTVVKALSLLDHFDARTPVIGVGEMARLAALRRHLHRLSGRASRWRDPEAPRRQSQQGGGANCL